MTNDGVCPICSGKNLEIYMEDEERIITFSVLGPSRIDVSPGRILRCLSCRFGFRQARPSDEDLGRLYEQLDMELYEAESQGRSRTARRQLKVVERYARPPGRILDIGCASGLFLRCAVNAGWEVEGIEPCDPLVRKAKEHLGAQARIHSSTLQVAPLARASFDVVTLWDVLEHVPDVIDFLNYAGSLLKSGRGYLFANVPDLDSIQARLLRSKWPLLLPEHLNYFNRESLRLCGAKAGLQWIGSFRRLANFSLRYILFRLQQHCIPGASFVFRSLENSGVKNLIVPVPLGEICGVWRSS
jgi:SAM-dependent methyltransferase